MSSTTDPKQPKSQPESAGSEDVVLIHGKTDDQKGLKVLRARSEGIELGEVRPLEEGKAITGDVVRLEPRPGLPFVCDVKTEFRYPGPGASKPASQAAADSSAPRNTLGHSGPAKVTTEAYRLNWDAIWKRGSGDPN